MNLGSRQQSSVVIIKILDERVMENFRGYTGADNLEDTDLLLKIGQPDINLSHDIMQ